MNKDGKERFNGKAKIYDTYRPEYPKEVLDYIIEYNNINTEKDIIADIGAGTGKLTSLLVTNGLRVIAVEPNDEMRMCVEDKLKKYDNFKAINGTAENTGLDDNSISLITVAQAFHYFNLDKTKKEFMRILKPEGKVVLLWNFRNRDSKFIKEYEQAIYSFHSNKVEPTHAQDKMTNNIFAEFFSEYEIKKLKNTQYFDLDGLIGRTLSNNHMPQKGEPHYDELIDKIQNLFEKYSVDGKVEFSYNTKIVIGSL